MIATIFGAFRVADIRKKVLFTAAILALYRLGRRARPGAMSTSWYATPRSTRITARSKS
jgi:preprotein translocase subunit SecY